MKTIAIASQKGGAGKSTLTLHLSVLAQDAGKTLVIDLDPQGSATFWHSRRENPYPVLVQAAASQLGTVLDAARADDIEWVFIDTAPHDNDSMAAAMRAADLVIIPARPSAFDLHATWPTLAMVQTLRKPYAVVLSQTPPKRGIADISTTTEARQLLKGQGANVSPVTIAQRVISAQSIIVGLAVNEIDPDSLAAQEYRALWNTILKGEIAP